jgi:biotin carboxyl carrier protein
VEVNGKEYEIELKTEAKKEVIPTKINRSEVTTQSSKPQKVKATPGSVLAPIPGLVLKILVKEGSEVKIGDPILILEAMKMESEIASTASGVVKSIKVKEGDTVQEDEVLVEIGE